MIDPTDVAMQWLNIRLTDVPDSLRTKVLSAAQRVSRTVVSPVDVFQAAADDMLREVLDGVPASDAVTLLAADALITYVCEYLSEHETESLSRLQ